MTSETLSRRKERQSIRKDMRAVLASLDRRWIDAASREVCAHLTRALDQSDREIAHLLAWVPFFPGEVNLSSFITEQASHRVVYLPRLVDQYAMEFVAIGDDWVQNLSRRDGKIPEPPPSVGKVFDPALAPLTAVVVPGLAFDREGNRLGRGSGYYDRFFGKAGMGAALRIGVCWSLQVVPSIPPEPHDALMDIVCHEREIIAVG